MFIEFRTASELKSENLSMPKLYNLDSYDDCLLTKEKFSSPVYCIAEVYIEPNKSNHAWTVIEEKSLAWKTHYRHDHLVFGVCVSRCKKLMRKFDRMTQKEYFNQTPMNFSIPQVDLFTFNGAIEDEVEFGKLVNECINYQLKTEYQLVSRSQIQYCEVSGSVDEIGKIEKFCQPK